MAKKRILIFSTAYFPLVGGAEVAVREITNRLEDVFEFDLITAKLKKELPSLEKINAVNVYRIGWGIPLLDKLLLPFLGAHKAWNLNKDRKYFALWGIMASFATGAGYILNILRQAAGREKIPMVLTLQEGDSDQYLKTKWMGLIHLAWKMALARTDCLTAISNYLLERARHLGFKGRAELIPNGVDVKSFLSSKHKPFDPDDITLITTSRLVKKNGVGDVIKSLALLPERVKFIIIGTGHLEHELKDLVRKLRLEERIEFLGLIDMKEIPAYLHDADIFVRPSLSEGMGNSFIEAMAAGLPVIATPVGGIVDFIKDGETGLFAEVENPKSIAVQVERLMSDPSLVAKLKVYGEQLVKEKYDWELIAKDMKDKVFSKV